MDVEHDGGSEQRCAPMIEEDVFNPLLQLDIDGQDGAQSRCRRPRVQRAQDVAHRVDLDELPSGAAAELALVGGFDSGTSDLIAVEVARVGQLFILFGGDLAHVAENVPEQPPLLVAADRDGLDANAGKRRTARGHVDHLRRRRILGDEQGQERIVGVLSIPDSLLHVPGADVEHLGQFLGDGRDLLVGYIGRDEGDLVGRRAFSTNRLPSRS